MKTLPEDRLIQKGVAQGIGRLLRDVYDQDAVGPLPDHIAQLLLDWISSNHRRPAGIRLDPISTFAEDRIR
jgi:hypothetical protein